MCGETGTGGVSRRHGTNGARGDDRVQEECPQARDCCLLEKTAVSIYNIYYANRWVFVCCMLRDGGVL